MISLGKANQTSKTKFTKDDIASAYRESAANHPGPALSREELCSLLGGAISVRRLSNMDSEGIGPDGAFYQGRKRMYLKGPAVEWAIGRIKMVDSEK